MSQSSKKQSNICNKCGKGFKWPWMLRRHDTEVHDRAPRENRPRPTKPTPRIHSCPLCNEKFSRISLKNQHYRKKHQLHYQSKIVPGTLRLRLSPVDRALKDKEWFSSDSESDSDIDKENTSPGSARSDSPSSPEIGAPNEPIPAKRRKVETSKQPSTSHDRRHGWTTPEPGPSHRSSSEVDWDSIPKSDETVGGLIRPMGESNRHNNRLRLEETVSQFRFTARARRLVGSGRGLEIIGGVFRRLMEQIAAKNEHSFIYLELDAPALDYPIIDIVRPVDHKEFDIDNFLEQIANAMDSKSDFNIRNPMTLRIVVANLPPQLGGLGAYCLPKHYETFLEFLRAKKSCWDPGCQGSECVLRCVAVGLKLRTERIRQCRMKQWYARPDESRELAGWVNDIAAETEVPVDTALNEQDFHKIQSWLNREHDGLQLVVFDRADRWSDTVYRGRSTKRTINPRRDVLPVAITGNHAMLVKNVRSFLSKRKLCSLCYVFYQRNHSCREICYSCRTQHCDLKNRRQKRPQAPIRCLLCNCWFRSKRCFRQHRAFPTCDMYERCIPCGKVVKTLDVMSGEHAKSCGQRTCASCKVSHHKDTRHLCMIKKINVDTLAPRKDMKLIFLDYETLLNRLEHFVYCACAIKMCTDCVNFEPEIEDCPSHGNRHFIFFGLNALKEINRWLFFDKANENAVALAHNGSRFDSWLSLQYFLDHTEHKPTVLANGTQLLELKAGRNVRLKDTYLFWQQPLAKIYKCMGLAMKNFKKGNFPHKFITKHTLDYDGPMVDEKFFFIENMSKGELKDFRAWRTATPRLNVRKMAIEYCMQDCNIGAKAASQYRNLLLEETKIDPFEHALTTAHLAALIFRSNSLQHSIGVVPPEGYNRPGANSLMAVKYLAYVARERGIHIETSLNGTEKTIDGIPVDGYCEDDGDKEAFQVAGCWHHSCPKLECPIGIKNWPNKRHPFHDCTHWENYCATLHNREMLRQKGYIVHLIWEHEIREKLRSEPNFREFFNDKTNWVDYKLPMRPRDALYGGRCESFSLLRELTEEELAKGMKIKQLDVQSLYPTVQLTSKYPLKHPKVVSGSEITKPIEDFIPEDFEAGGDWFGTIHCTVEGPRKLFVPLLPYKSKVRNKLFFSCCRTCSDVNWQEGPCPHSSEERRFTNAYVSVELAAALREGYRLHKIHSAWVYSESTDLLFSKYMIWAVAKKIEASEPPKDIELDDFIKGMDDRFGIKLNKDQIKFNPASRFEKKLRANSLWGKFGQDNKKDNVNYVSSYEELVKLLSDSELIIKSLKFSVGQTAMVISQVKEQARSRVHGLHSPVIAAFTTSYARLYMFPWLKKLGSRLLYIDTDCYAFVSIPGEPEPPVGPFLGDLSDELPGDYGTLWVSTGPKCYGIITAKGEQKTRAKGIQIRGEVNDLVHPLTLKALMLRDVEQLEKTYDNITDLKLRDKLKTLAAIEAQKGNLCLVVPDDTMKRNKATAKIRNVKNTKRLRVTFDKRQITHNKDGIITFPHGY